MGTYRGRFHKDRAVAGNNSLQAGNTPQRAGHAAAVIQFSKMLSFWKSLKLLLSGFQTRSYTSLKTPTHLASGSFPFSYRAHLLLILAVCEQEACIPLEFIKPQLATAVDKPPARAGWIHEVKPDSYRTLLIIELPQSKCLYA